MTSHRNNSKRLARRKEKNVARRKARYAREAEEAKRAEYASESLMQARHFTSSAKRGGSNTSGHYHSTSSGSAAKVRKHYRIDRVRLLISVVIIIFLIIIGINIGKVVSLQHEQTRLEKQNKELTVKKNELHEELKGVNKDSYIIQQARTQLHMIQPGEVMYVLKDDNPNKDNNGSKDSNN